MLEYTITSTRQESLFPFSGCCRRSLDSHSPTPRWLQRVKKAFFNEQDSIPTMPQTLNDGVFSRLRECVVHLRAKYTEARLHILYGVLIEDAPLISDSESERDSPSQDGELLSAARQSRLVSVDPEIFQDQE